ncbi:anaerobic ribonucleoside-triphosphate reductase activating protein [Fusibacter paucivorans]|uniref:Anaerobic ribonucleoside-triphosphate reductase activating protein n=1 Tax=Fusibacter paucivorans TaxID=76009 RepID=A0ABS5PPC7_9FIRM|nr:anaerobic ribonucleoside-triphosphate reductase activating protein [Fusibacter paucivorans]MBS7527015.1 anaerobic ribonucleoside-triphosphate reductase activating protein [Fusibacter paucivorans]
MNIGGFLKTSYSDFPGHLSSVIFTNGCNFKCPYCHNGDLASGRAPATETFDTILTKLDQRRQHIRAVVISGGEPTLYRDLPDCIRMLKNEGYAVKLDTNGSNPEMLEHLLRESLLDYVAMDYKWLISDYAPFIADPVLAASTAWLNASIDLTIGSGIDHEFRTTVLSPYHREDVLEKMGRRIAGAQAWSLQQYQYTANQLEDCHFETYSKSVLEAFANCHAKAFPKMKIRVRAKV